MLEHPTSTSTFLRIYPPQICVEKHHYLLSPRSVALWCQIHCRENLVAMCPNWLPTDIRPCCHECVVYIDIIIPHDTTTHMHLYDSEKKDTALYTSCIFSYCTSLAVSRSSVELKETIMEQQGFVKRRGIVTRNNTRYICHHIRINQSYGAKVKFSVWAKINTTFSIIPLRIHITLVQSEYQQNHVLNLLFNGVLISTIIKCATWLVYANMWLSMRKGTIRWRWDRGFDGTHGNVTQKFFF